MKSLLKKLFPRLFKTELEFIIDELSTQVDQKDDSEDVKVGYCNTYNIGTINQNRNSACFQLDKHSHEIKPVFTMLDWMPTEIAEEYVVQFIKKQNANPI